LLLNFFESGKGNRGAKIVCEDEVVLKIGEDQDGEIETGVEKRELSFLKLAAAILGLKFGLDGVGVSSLAAFFELLGELEEAIAFVGSAFGDVEFVLRGQSGEVTLDNGDNEAARSNFGFCAGDGRDGSCTLPWLRYS